MKNTKSLIIYGFLIWLVPFVISFFIFPLHQNDRVFFETLMSIILITTIMAVLIKYSQTNALNTAKEGLFIGLIWMVLNLILDSFIFIWGPLARPLGDYIKDIGLMYLLIPIITTAVTGIRNVDSPKTTTEQAI